MNYKQIYNTLVEKFQDKEKDPSMNYDNHHIIPRCMGGNDESGNLVSMPVREHFFAHLLLTRIYPDSLDLMRATFLMSGRSGRRIPSSIAGAARGEFRDQIASIIKDTWAKKKGFSCYQEQCEVVWNEYMVECMSVNDIAGKYKVAGETFRNCLRFYADAFGMQEALSEEIVRRNAEHMKRVRANLTSEQEAKRIAAVKKVDRRKYASRLKVERKGAGNPMFGRKRIPRIVECPCCQKSGAESQMKRWHFNNCKQRENNNEDQKCKVRLPEGRCV